MPLCPIVCGVLLMMLMFAPRIVACRVRRRAHGLSWRYNATLIRLVLKIGGARTGAAAAAPVAAGESRAGLQTRRFQMSAVYFETTCNTPTAHSSCLRPQPAPAHTGLVLLVSCAAPCTTQPQHRRAVPSSQSLRARPHARGFARAIRAGHSCHALITPLIFKGGCVRGCPPALASTGCGAVCRHRLRVRHHQLPNQVALGHYCASSSAW